MNKESNKDTIYDLEERTTEFAKRIVKLCKEVPNNNINKPIVSQIIRSSGSVGANYMEANDALGKKDFRYRLRTARKEVKETIYWLQIINEANPDIPSRTKELHKEAVEIRNILSAIIKEID